MKTYRLPIYVLLTFSCTLFSCKKDIIDPPVSPDGNPDDEIIVCYEQIIAKLNATLLSSHFMPIVTPDN